MYGIAAASVAGAVAGTVIPVAGGRMFGGSLDLLAQSFPESRLRLSEIGGLFGETGFGPISQMVSGGFEGLVFAGCTIAAMTIARRQLSDQAWTRRYCADLQPLPVALARCDAGSAWCALCVSGSVTRNVRYGWKADA